MRPTLGIVLGIPMLSLEFKRGPGAAVCADSGRIERACVPCSLENVVASRRQVLTRQSIKAGRRVQYAWKVPVSDRRIKRVLVTPSAVNVLEPLWITRRT